MTEETEDLTKLTKDKLVEKVKQLQEKEAANEKKAKQSIYARLSKIDVKPYLKGIPRWDKKKRAYISLDYLSWANALALVKSVYPDTTCKIKEFPNWQKTADGNFQQVGTLDYRLTAVGCEVEVTVTINGHNFTQKLYPMDGKMNPIFKPNIKDINKAQQRCIVKALATAGLGLEVYAGEDLPATEDDLKETSTTKPHAVKNRSNVQKRASTARQNYTNFTDNQLENYRVMYRPTKDADPKEMLIGIIYNNALKGDKEAAKWWHEQRKHLNTPEGQALIQYEALARRLAARSAAKRKALKESVNKISQSARNAKEA